MDKKKIKRIIAREGLIFLGIVIVSIFTGNRGYHFFWTQIAPQFNYRDFPITESAYPQRTFQGAILDNIKSLYIIYLSLWAIFFLVRFIIWAVKTLKEK